MSSLKKLRIECSYDPSSLEELKYSVSIDQTRLKNPAQARKYFTRIINAISNDAANKGGLEHLTVCVDERYFSNLQSVAKDLLAKSKKQKEMAANFNNAPTLYKVFVIGGAVVGGIGSLVLGYDQMAEWATDVANHMNNASHLWSPLTGLAQTGISLVGTAVTTVVGAFGGAVVGIIVASPYHSHKTSLAPNFSKYQNLESALTQAEFTPNQESG